GHFPRLDKKRSSQARALCALRYLSSLLPCMSAPFSLHLLIMRQILPHRKSFSYSAFPSHPHIFMRIFTCSLTASIAAVPNFFGSYVSGFSSSSFFTAAVYAARSSVAKFTLHIPRSTHSLTSSSLKPDAPWSTSGTDTTSRIALTRGLSSTGVPT